MLKHILLLLCKSIPVFLAGIPLLLLGLPMVALALPFRTLDTSTGRAFTQYPDYGYWYRVRLPKWARLWDNAFDGAYGYAELDKVIAGTRPVPTIAEILAELPSLVLP